MRPAALAVVLVSFCGVPAAAQDAIAGEQLFRRCLPCHAVGEGAANRIGPVLNDIVGQPAAAVPDFNYSAALRAAAEQGLVWTPEQLAALLRNARQFVPGTSMAFAPMTDETDIADIVAYLAALSPGFTPTAPGAAAPPSPPPRP